MNGLNGMGSSRKKAGYMRLAAGLCSLAAAFGAWAQIDSVPGEVNYQAALFESDGVTLRTGPVDLEFRIYAAQGDMTPIWGELHTGVDLFEGVFNVMLGTGMEIDGATPHGGLAGIFDGSGRWIGLTVVGEDELPERQQINSAPYAFTANTAVFALHGAPVGSIAVWGGDINDVPEGWLACIGQSLSRTEYPELFATLGLMWGAGNDPGTPTEPGTTFSLPNFGGRTLIGDLAAGEEQNNTDGSSAMLTPKSLTDRVGESAHVLTIGEMAAHTHSYQDRRYSGTQDSAPGLATARPDIVTTQTRTTTATGGIDTTNDLVPDSAAPHNTVQPSIAVNFIIKSN